MALSNENVAYLALTLGHALVVQPRRGSFVAVCSCGYSSTKRRTVRLAIEAAIHHQEVMIRAFMATGRPWPLPKADTPPEEDVFENRSSVVA